MIKYLFIVLLLAGACQYKNKTNVEPTDNDIDSIINEREYRAGHPDTVTIIMEHGDHIDTVKCPPCTYK